MAHCDAQRLPNALVGANAKKSPATKRAAQSVPPKVRREVLRHDRHRCRVPGCTHARFVDVHHVHARADGGGHDAKNLVTLCGAHHRAVHEGTLLITSSAEGELGFRHADATRYGARPSAASSLVQAHAFQALRGLGFGEREVRRTLAEARLSIAGDAPLDHVLRYCLEQLTTRVCQRAS